MLTVPAGKVAVIEYATVHASAGISEMFIDVQTQRAKEGSMTFLTTARIPLTLTAQAPPARLPLSANQPIRAYATGGRPIKIQISTEAAGNTELWGFVSGNLVPEK